MILLWSRASFHEAKGDRLAANAVRISKSGQPVSMRRVVTHFLIAGLIAMLKSQNEWIALFLILFFIAFISDLLVGASFSWYTARKEPEPRHPRLASAEGEPRHDGKKRSTNLTAVVIALVVVSGAIVLDHFTGPLFPDVFYCLNDGGSQGMCTAHRNLIAKSP